MILLLCSFLAAASPPGAGDAIGARIAASASAAERLQGPLDGAWVVRDGRGRPRLRLEIEDPAQASGPLTGAWSRADGSAMGPIDQIEATRGALRIRVKSGEQLVFERHGQNWRGRMLNPHRVVPVTLSRR